LSRQQTDSGPHDHDHDPCDKAITQQAYSEQQSQLLSSIDSSLHAQQCRQASNTANTHSLALLTSEKVISTISVLYHVLWSLRSFQSNVDFPRQ
jgi:hypothetical protein